jgi:hypothetical protein
MATPPGNKQKRLELRGALPCPVDYMETFRAHHLALDRDIEFRISLPDAPPDKLEIFKREMVLLSASQHPLLPVVLDRGGFQGRYYLCVPPRKGKPISERIDDPGFRLEERCQMARSLATLLSVLHRQNMHTGRLHPELLNWREDTGQPELRHIPGPSWHKLGGRLPDLPDDFQERNLSPNEADILHWSLLTYWTLGQGIRPFTGGDDGEPELYTPLRTWTANIHPDFAELVDACLAPQSPARPSDGLELREVLRELPRNLDPPEREAPGECQSVLQQSLLGVRERLEKSGTSLGKPPLASPLQMANMEPALDAFKSVVEGAEENWKKVLVGAVVLLLLLLFTLDPFGATEEGAANTSHGPVEEFDHGRDPFVLHLLRIEAVTPKTFDKAWMILRNLALRSRLPIPVTDAEELMLLRQQYPKEPEKVCAKLDAMLSKIRREVEEVAEVEGG